MEPTARPSNPNPPAPVAAPPPAPYTASMAGERPAAPIPWWRDTVKGWAPALGAVVMVVVHLTTVQQQIGDLRADIPEMIRAEVRAEVGALREEMREEMRDLRQEMRDLRAEMRQEMEKLRSEFRLENDRLWAEIRKVRADVDVLRQEMAAMRTEFGERITRLEVLVQRLIEMQEAARARGAGGGASEVRFSAN